MTLRTTPPSSDDDDDSTSLFGLLQAWMQTPTNMEEQLKMLLTQTISVKMVAMQSSEIPKDTPR
jgi:hypothetical protein